MYKYSLDPKHRLKRIQIMADYQFGFGSGIVLFDSNCIFILSKTKRVKQVLDINKNRLATIRTNDGFITLSIYGANILKSHLKYPKQRVIISEESVPYVSKGKTVFCKHVIDLDMDLRSMDEVLIVDSKDNLIATGQLLLSPLEIKDGLYGAAVFTRSYIS